MIQIESIQSQSEKNQRSVEYFKTYEFESNQVFVEISKEDIKKWEKFAYFEVGEKRKDKFVARFVTTYKSQEKEIEEFLERI